LKCESTFNEKLECHFELPIDEGFNDLWPYVNHNRRREHPYQDGIIRRQ